MERRFDRKHSDAVAEFLREESTCVASLDEIADAIPDDVHGWERTDLWLHHVHLPRLSRDGRLDYDHRTNTVRFEDDGCGQEDRAELLVSGGSE